ncbi:MAG: hypothetical protein ACI4Q4_00400, partial [Oscillospiraceae bacterium]
SVAPVFWIILGVGFALNTINRRLDKGESVDVDEPVDVSRKMSREEENLVREAENLGSVLAVKIREQKAENAEEPRVITSNDIDSLLSRVSEITEKAEKQAEQPANPDSGAQNPAAPDEHSEEQ